MGGNRINTRLGGTAAVMTAVVALLGACGSGSDAAPGTPPGQPATVALGEFPEPLSGAETPPNPPTTVVVTTSTSIPLDEPIAGPISERAAGPRVLLIGDSILASTAPRFGGIMCDVLTELGWDLELDAESGRFVEFGSQVLGERLRPDQDLDWDVAGIFLGNNFDGDVEAYREELIEMIERLAPRPTILYTLTANDLAHAALNLAITDLAEQYPNIVVVDWAVATDDEPQLLLQADRLHLTDIGRERLVLLTAATLGINDDGRTGTCFPSPFQDDTTIDQP